jgi:hypothetical protein
MMDEIYNRVVRACDCLMPKVARVLGSISASSDAVESDFVILLELLQARPWEDKVF